VNWWFSKEEDEIKHVVDDEPSHVLSITQVLTLNTQQLTSIRSYLPHDNLLAAAQYKQDSVNVDSLAVYRW